MSQKNIVIIFLSFSFIVGGLILVFSKKTPLEIVVEEVVVEEVVPEIDDKEIGKSIEDRSIESYKFGYGEKNILFVGGLHGGYEWNSVLLAYEMIDYFKANPRSIPDDLSVSIIPSLNPDGVFKFIGKEGRFEVSDVPAVNNDIGVGRFNANDVDLNRNFDCKWQPESSWKGNIVSAGTEAFSELETVVLRDYVLQTNPESVIFWHSKANNVYASECENGVLPETVQIMNLYANAANYGAVETFDAYPVTGDAEGWLASINIPALTVELETRNNTEFDRNILGVKSIINYYTTY